MWKKVAVANLIGRGSEMKLSTFLSDHPHLTWNSRCSLTGNIVAAFSQREESRKFSDVEVYVETRKSTIAAISVTTWLMTILIPFGFSSNRTVRRVAQILRCRGLCGDAQGYCPARGEAKRRKDRHQPGCYRDRRNGDNREKSAARNRRRYAKLHQISN
ncbi:hypothetical protein OROGR_008583 [Orobanche gracilis]